MWQAIDELIEDGRIEGRQEGQLEKLIQLVLKKRDKHYTAEQTAEILEEDIELIQRIYTFADMSDDTWEICMALRE